MGKSSSGRRNRRQRSDSNQVHRDKKGRHRPLVTTGQHATLEPLESRVLMSATTLFEPVVLPTSVGQATVTGITPGPEQPTPLHAPSATEPTGQHGGDIAQANQQISNNQLVMHLQFDGNTGTTATDSSPHGDNNDGTLRNGASFHPGEGHLGGAVNLDGEDDHVRVDNSSSLNLGVHAKRTIGVWFKVQDASLSNHKQIIYEEGGRNRGLNIYVHDGALYVGGWNSPRRGWTGTYLSTDAINSGTWHHVALVLNAEPKAKQVQDDALVAYLDGTEFGRGQGSRLQRHSGGIGIGGTNGRTRLHDGVSGKRQRHGLEGQIADARVYNRSLGESEIAVMASDRTSSGIVFEELADGSFVARPEGTGPFPAVLYNHGGLGTSVGGDLKGTCIALAEAGYLARAELRPQSISLDGQLEDVLYGLDQLRNHPDADTSKVAIMGFSRGGLLALQAAIERPGDIDAVVLMAPAPGKGTMEEILTDVSSLTAPVHIYVAENDNQGRHDLVQLAGQVEQTLREADKDVQLTIYPPFAANGHELFFEVREPYWSDVLEFITQIEYAPIDVAGELNFVTDPGIRLEEGTIPEAGIEPGTGTVYLYYKVGTDAYVATSEDGGLDFSGNPQSPAQPANKAFDPRCTLMPQVDQDGLPVWREFLWQEALGYFTSLVSSDGVHYQPEEGVRYDPPDTDNVGVYTTYTTANGRVGLMYIGDKGTAAGNVRLAYSDDNGQSFQHYDDNPLDDAGTHDEGLNQRDPTAVVLDDGRIRIFTMVQGGPQAPHPGVRSVTSIHSFTSTDNGLTFTADPDMRLEPSDFTEFDVWSLNDPSIIELPDGRYRMYVAGLISELPDASDARWVILSATTTMDGPDGGQETEQPSPLQLDHVSTYEMAVGTHRPEMMTTESGQMLAVVVHPGEQDDGSLIKHRVYRFDSDGQPVGDPFAVTWATDEYGEPADHRAVIVDGELIIVYQSLVFDHDISSTAGGPAEQYALNQSLMLARYSLDGEELFRGPIVAHVTNFDEDNFPDHCLVPLDHSLLVSTGSQDQIKLRVVDYQGEVLNTYAFSTSEIRSLSSIGNSLLRVGDQLWMFAASGTRPGGSSGISVLKLGAEYQPTELAWFSQDGQERTFPTGNLQYNGYTFVTYDVRDAQDSPVGPEDVPFQPRLMVLDEQMNLVLDMQIGSGEGFAHVHPTMTMVDGELVIGWSMQAEGVDHRVPQVKLERYALEFPTDGGVHVTQDLKAGITALAIQ